MTTTTTTITITTGRTQTYDRGGYRRNRGGRYNGQTVATCVREAIFDLRKVRARAARDAS